LTSGDRSKPTYSCPETLLAGSPQQAQVVWEF
jgi:hypothetical protein